MLPAEDLTEYELIQVLLKIKLRAPTRNKVVRAKTAFQANGALPMAQIRELRTIYKRHSKAIKTLLAARERARISMAKRKMGLTSKEVERRQEERLSQARRRVEDFGI